MRHVLRLRGFTRWSSKGPPSPIIKRKDKSNQTESPPFIDRKEVQVQGGKGGDGCISLASVFAKEHAGPDGGDGGSGGHVFFKSTTSTRSLNLPSIIKGLPGRNGSGSNCQGRNGLHRIIPVPLGTLVKCEERSISDLNKEGQLFLAARGGAGGKGNKFFTGPNNQSPEIAEFGSEGELKRFSVELSTIAEFGLVGFPNAGKSTLLRAISRARPKVAQYPFTTLRPHVGVVLFDDLVSVRVADTPGLIEDAHKNRGLGHDFLRHIKRCLCLVFVLDISASSPWEEYETLRSELSHYDAELLIRPSLVLANKIDVEGADRNLDLFKDKYPGIQVFPISAKFGLNLKGLLEALRGVFDLHVGKGEPEIPYSPVRGAQGKKKWR